MNKQIYGYIYIIKNLINNKCYVGQTCQKGGFDRRYKHNIAKYTSNIHLKRAIDKYGIENFEINKEFDIAYSKEELDEKEVYWISKLKTTDQQFGYNIREGGSKGKLSEETKEKLRQINLGKKYSKETNEKKACPKEANGMYGKHHSSESIEKMSRNRKGLTVGNTHPRSKRILCITTGKDFDCQREAGEYYNIKTYTHISRVCNGKLQTYGKLPDGTKLKWKFL